MPQSVRHKRKAARDRLGLVLIALAILLACGLFAASKYIQGKRPALDNASMCPVDGPAGLIVLLVDTTDPLNAIQQADLRNQLERLKSGMPKYYAIEVYTVSEPKEGLLKPLGARVCNPGDSRDASELTSNPRLIKERWEKRFSAPLEDLFTRMLVAPTAKESPIFESIQSVAVTAFGSLHDSTSHRTLVIVSDMLQNMPEYSQYRQIGTFQDFEHSAYYQRIKPDLRGVDVELYYIRRDQNVQLSKHILFWQDYFVAAGATLTHVVRLEG
jgi:hypothetical protein